MWWTKYNIHFFQFGVCVYQYLNITVRPFPQIFDNGQIVRLVDCVDQWLVDCVDRLLVDEVEARVLLVTAVCPVHQPLLLCLVPLKALSTNLAM